MKLSTRGCCLPSERERRGFEPSRCRRRAPKAAATTATRGPQQLLGRQHPSLSSRSPVKARRAGLPMAHDCRALYEQPYGGARLAGQSSAGASPTGWQKMAVWALRARASVAARGGGQKRLVEVGTVRQVCAGWGVGSWALSTRAGATSKARNCDECHPTPNLLAMVIWTGPVLCHAEPRAEGLGFSVSLSFLGTS